MIGGFLSCCVLPCLRMGAARLVRGMSAARFSIRRLLALSTMTLSRSVRRCDTGVGNGLFQRSDVAAGGSRLLLRRYVCAWLQRGEGGMIDSAAVAKIFATLMGCWALGFGVGNAVYWVRKIRDVA